MGCIGDAFVASASPCLLPKLRTAMVATPCCRRTGLEGCVWEAARWSGGVFIEDRLGCVRIPQLSPRSCVVALQFRQRLRHHSTPLRVLTAALHTCMRHPVYCARFTHIVLLPMAPAPILLSPRPSRSSAATDTAIVVPAASPDHKLAVQSVCHVRSAGCLSRPISCPQLS
jgi:hypothetical protein